MTIQIILGIIGVAGAVFGGAGFWGYMTTRSKQETATERLLLGLAFCEITRSCEAYIERGYISTAEYNELDRYLYKPYAEAGGDGTAEKLMGEVRKLPTEIDKD